MLDAQYRRAVALHRLGKFADADACLAWVMAVCGGARLADAEKMVGGVDAEGRYTVTKADVERMLREKRAEQEAGMSAEEMLAGATQQQTGGSVWKMAGSLRLSVLQAMQASAEDHPGRKLSAPVVPPKAGAPAVIARQGEVAPKPVLKQVRVDAYESDGVPDRLGLYEECRQGAVQVRVRGAQQGTFSLRLCAPPPSWWFPR